jgi:hypothetical protein
MITVLDPATISIYDVVGTLVAAGVPLPLGDVYSNFDHRYDNEVRLQLEASQPMAACHPGWEFHSTIVHDNDRYTAYVMRFNTLVAAYQADTLEAVIEHTIENWGDA